jgi:hypothetical protein
MVAPRIHARGHVNRKVAGWRIERRCGVDPPRRQRWEASANAIGVHLYPDPLCGSLRAATYNPAEDARGTNTPDKDKVWQRIPGHPIFTLLSPHGFLHEVLCYRPSFKRFSYFGLTQSGHHTCFYGRRRTSSRIQSTYDSE